MTETTDYEVHETAGDTPALRLIRRHWGTLGHMFTAAFREGSGVVIVSVDSDVFGMDLATETWLGGDAVACVRTQADIAEVLAHSGVPDAFVARALDAFDLGVPILAFVGADVALRVAARARS